MPARAGVTTCHLREFLKKKEKPIDSGRGRIKLEKLLKRAVQRTDMFRYLRQQVRGPQGNRLIAQAARRGGRRFATVNFCGLRLMGGGRFPS